MTATSGSPPGAPPPGAPRTTASGLPSVPGQKPCHHCGRRIAAQLPVCPFCGARGLNPPEVGVEPAPRTGHTMPAGALAPPPASEAESAASAPRASMPRATLPAASAPTASARQASAPPASRTPAAPGPFVTPIERTADQAPLVAAAGPRAPAMRTDAFNRFEVESQVEWPPGPASAAPPRLAADLGRRAADAPPAPAPGAAFDALGRGVGTAGAGRPSQSPPSAPPVRADEGLWPPVKRPPPRVLGNPGLGAPRIDRRSRLIWAALVAVVAAAAVAFMVLRPKHFPLAQLADGPTAVPCDGRRFCVLVYLAPWDPASERSLGTVERLNALFPPNGDVGLAVVIGADEPEARAEFAGRVQAPTYFEVGEGLLTGLDLQRVPTWWLLDARGRITRTVDGTYFPLERHLAALGVRHDAAPGRRGSP